MKRFRWAILVVLAAISAYAQLSSNVTVFATGFSNPRGLKWGSDGNLYVAEGGSGGNFSTADKCTQVVPPIGPYTGGTTARISKVTPDGTRSTFVGGLPSTRAAVGDISGVADVAFIAIRCTQCWQAEAVLMDTLPPQIQCLKSTRMAPGLDSRI